MKNSTHLTLRYLLSNLGISFNQVKPKEQTFSALGAFLGLLLSSLVSHLILGSVNPWFVAPMGASAVLLFAVPASPLAQPWSILGGNLVASLIGVWAAHTFVNINLALSAAVGLAIFVMIGLRCLHPPSGAIAMTAVLGGPAVYELGYGFALWPVAINSALMLLAALLFNNLIGRRYPHPSIQQDVKTHVTNPLPSDRLGVTSEDFQQVMNKHAELLDINASDLKELMFEAQQQAYQRITGNVRCQDIMTKNVLYLKADDSLVTALSLFEQNNLMSLPVLNEQHQLVGSLSVYHLMQIYDGYVGFRTHLDGPAQFVYQVMERKVFTVKADQPLSDLIPFFTDKGFHYLPVVGAERTLEGIIGRADVIAALFELQVSRE
ncbi:HPP family protein [Alkanindiges illinoisensis]|uniref:HPP family protein n=1 Tax=Alkanindiges illinoisensis TaxID=197183 RepID=UPI000684C43F|nr:HPP family protein [Alkanindiges illinoisensis]